MVTTVAKYIILVFQPVYRKVYKVDLLNSHLQTS